MQFISWLRDRDHQLWQEFVTVGHSEDWGDTKAANSRFNDERYRARGIRSRYIAHMKTDKKKRQIKPK